MAGAVFYSDFRKDGMTDFSMKVFIRDGQSRYTVEDFNDKVQRALVELVGDDIHGSDFVVMTHEVTSRRERRAVDRLLDV